MSTPDEMRYRKAAIEVAARQAADLGRLIAALPASVEEGPDPALDLPRLLARLTAAVADIPVSRPPPPALAEVTPDGVTDPALTRIVRHPRSPA